MYVVLAPLKLFETEQNKVARYKLAQQSRAKLGRRTVCGAFWW